MLHVARFIGFSACRSSPMPTDGTLRDSFAGNCGAPVSFAEDAKKAFQHGVDLMSLVSL